MTWHPLDLLRIIFAVLVCGMIIAGFTTRARPQTPRQWTLVWAVIVFLAWALLGLGWLRAGALVSGRQQTGELTGIRGLPVEGHDIVAGIEIVGTKHIDRPGLRDRLRPHGAELRLGWPLESQTLCRFKEVLRDLLAEKGFPDAEVTHETRSTQGNRRHLTVRFTIAEGRRGRPIRASALLSPAQRCAR